MELRPLGRTGVSASQFCLGAMMFGAWGNPDHDESARTSTSRTRAQQAATLVPVGGGELESGAIRDEIRVRARPLGRDLVRVEEATLGVDSGVIGAAALAKNPTGGPLLWVT